MYSLGIDIGTTTITSVVVENKKLIETMTDANEFVKTNESFAFIQDPKQILKKVLKQVDTLTAKYKEIKSIGITGQMHGIVYVNKDFELLSPLYTWCDQRASEKLNGTTYKDYAYSLTNIMVPVGYGLLTHFYNLMNNLVNFSNYTILTIHDYIANYLSSNSDFVIHSSDAQSLGYFDLRINDFKYDKLSLLGIRKEHIPKVTNSLYPIGEYKGIKVYPAIGDNQASFYGATKGKNALLINFGTGSQISIKTKKVIRTSMNEVRPYLDNEFLIVGASLCGGKSFEALAKLYSSISNKSLEETYKDLVNIEYKKTNLKFETLFLGTRADNSKRATISNISLDSFNKDEIAIALLDGMVDELYDFFEEMKDINFDLIVGSGNGIRKNKLLVQIIENKFKQKLEINEIKEEAAYGAALVSTKGE